MKYHIITFGCQMNKSDSERIATVLENRGYQPASNINEADLIVVNMCSVRQSAVDRVYGKISDFAKLKVKNEKLKVILTGCITKSDKRKFENKFDQILKFKDLLKEQPKYQDKSIVYVPISSGCNNACTYCVVPFTRGSLVCRDHREILKEVKKVVQNGAKEIWLLGQNVNDYTSRTDGSIDFSELLRMINDIPGDFLIRFVSPNPKNFSDKLIETMVGAKKITKYLHLPVQSGDNEILKKMNRPYTVEQYKNLVKKIRKKIPKINLSTDIIVGFPGETEKQFQNTVKLFKEIKFNYAYIAKYSPRPGTAAFKLKDDVSLKEKKRRWKILNSYI
ncbi:MiaB/RimO family radical SAM methylthiotransferase [Patescibacteria group bacterium]|nr:MiaB/RimO family radical SAM methylthiotransferase [Patescibacteria group bacterium]MBU4481150.1 MiaB/RimO family radical SAM methylthiotransferase [Patescibacteria group bacterium]